MPTGCIWMDNLAETVTDNFLCRQFSRFGGVSHAVVDRLKGQGLIFFDSMENAQFALPEMRNRIWNGKKIHIDFASRDCQDRFFLKMEESGQLREGDRPDSRRIFKQQGTENYWEEGMEAEKYHITSSSAQPPQPPPVLNNATNSTSFVRGRGFNRRGGFNRGRGRGSGPGDRNWGRGGRFHNNFEEFSSPSSRRIQFDEYQSSGTYPEENSYEQELRAYGFSQRERRERLSQSPGHYEDYEYEEGSQSGRNYERFEKYGKEGHFDSYRSDSPGSDVELHEDDAKYRTRDERYYKDKYYPEQASRDRSVSSDKEQQKLRLSSDIASNRSWSPTSKEKRTKELPMSYRSQTPPTPTENEPVYHSRDHSPTDSAYRKYGDYKKRLSAGSGDGDKDTKSAVWNITLASTGLRKEIESVKTEERNARKRSYDDITSKGIVRHDLSVPNLERQSSRGSRTSSVDLDKLSAKVGKLKSEVHERTLGKLTGTSPSSVSSHGESEHGSLTESELLKLHKEKQLLLDKLKQLEDNGSTSDNESNELEDTRRVIAKKPRLDLASQNVAKYLQKADKLGLSSQEKIRLLDVSKSCRKQMEDLRKHEAYLREQKAKSNAESAKSFSDNDESHTVSPKDITSFLPKKRRKVDGLDMEENLRSRLYRMRKDQEEEGMFSSDDEKDLKRSQITENIFKQSSTHSKDESRRISSGSESAKEHGDRVRRKEDFVPPNIPLGDDHPNPDLKDPRTCKAKLEDTVMSLPLPKFAQNLPHVASPLSSPVPHLSSKQLSDLPSLSAAAKSASKSADVSSQDLYDPSKPTELSDHSPCFSPQSSSSKTQSPNGSPPESTSGNSKGISDSADGDYNGSQLKSELPEQKLELSVGNKVEDSKDKLELEDPDTFSDSNSEQSDSIDMENLSIEERIRRLDEKLCQAQVATATSKTLTSVALTSSPSSNVSSSLASSTAVTTSPVPSSLYSKFRIRKKNEPSLLLGKETSEPSEIVKQVLSKSSVFDQDSKRLEQISEKYEPKEVSLNLDDSPKKGPFRTKAAAKEMPLATLPGSLMERLGQTSSFPTLTVNTSLANQSFISVVTPNKFVELQRKDTSSSEVSTPKMSPANDQNGESTLGSSSSSNMNVMPSFDGPLMPAYHSEGLDEEAFPPKLETPSNLGMNHSLWKTDNTDYQHLLIKAPELEKQENLEMSLQSPMKATATSLNQDVNSEFITSLNGSPLTSQISTSKASPRTSYSPVLTPAAKKEPFSGIKENDSLSKDTTEKKETVPPKEPIQDSTYKPEMFGVCIVKESALRKDTGFETANSKDMKRDAFNLDIFGMSTPLILGKRKADESSKTEPGGTDKPMDIDSSVDENNVKTVNVSDENKVENMSVDATSSKPSKDKVKISSEKKKTEKETKKESLKQDGSKEPDSKKLKSSKDKKADSSKEEKHLKKSSSKETDKKIEHHRSSSSSDKKEKDKQKAKSEKKDKDGDKKIKEKKDQEEKKDDKKEDRKEKEEKKKKDGDKKEEKEKEKKSDKKDEAKKSDKKDKPEKKDKDGDKKDTHRHDKHSSSKCIEKKPKANKDASSDGKESTKDSDKKNKLSKSESSQKSKKPKEESSNDKSKDQEKEKAKDVEKKDISKEKKEQDREKKDLEKEKKENGKEKKEQYKEKKEQDKEKKEQDKEKKEQDKEKKEQDKEKKEQEKEKKEQDKEKKEQDREKKEQDKEKKEQDREKKEQDKEKKEQDREKKDNEKEVVKDHTSSDKSKENEINNDQNEKTKETKEKTKEHIAEKCKDHKAKDHKEKDNKDPDVSKGSKAGMSSSEKSKSSSSETKTLEKSKSEKDKTSKENSKTKSGGEKKSSKDSSTKQPDSSSSKKTKESGDSEKKSSKSEKSKSSKSGSETSKDDSKSKEKESTEKKENDSAGKKEKDSSTKKDEDSTDKKDKEKNSSGKKKERNRVNYFAVELDFEPYMSMYDKVKRRSTEKDKEKEMEDVRRRISKMQKGSRKKTSRSSDHSDDSMENSDDEDASICNETKEDKKGKYIFESSSELSNSSSEEAIFMSKPKGKIQTSKKKPKKFFDIYSSDSEEDEVVKEPDKPKPKSPTTKSTSQKVEKSKFLADSDDIDIELDSPSDHDVKSDKVAKPKTSKPKKINKATKSDKPASKEKKENKAKPQKQGSILSDDSDVFFKDKGLSDTESEMDIKPSRKVTKKQSDKKKSPPKGHSIYTSSSEEDDDELFSKFSSSLNRNNKASSQKVAEKETLAEVKELIESELKKSEPEKEPMKLTEENTLIPISDTETKSLKFIKKLKDKGSKSPKKPKKTKKSEPKISSDSVGSEAEIADSNLVSKPEAEVFSETVFEKDEPLIPSEELKMEKATPMQSDKEESKESSTRNNEDNEIKSSKKGKKHKKEGKKKNKDQEERNDISDDFKISQNQKKITLIEELNVSACLSGSSVCESGKVHDHVISRKNNLFDKLSNITKLAETSFVESPKLEETLLVESTKLEETSFVTSESRDNIFDKMTNITQAGINIKPEKEGRKKPKKKKKNQKEDKKDYTKKGHNESKKEICEVSCENEFIDSFLKDGKPNDLSKSIPEISKDPEVKLEKGDSKIATIFEPKDEKPLAQLEKAEKKNKKKEKSDKDNSNKSENDKSNKKKIEETKSSTVSDIFEFTEEDEDSLLPLKDMHAKLHRSESGGSGKTQEEVRDPVIGKTNTGDYKFDADKNKEDKVEENEFIEVQPKEVVVETKKEEKTEKSKSRPRKRKSRKNSNKDSEVSIEDVLSPNVQSVEPQEEEIVPEPTDISEVEAITTEIESNKPDQTLEAVSNLEKESLSHNEEEQTVSEVVTFDHPVSEEQELAVDEGIILQHVEDEASKAIESLVEDETANAVASILPLDDVSAFSVSSTITNQSSVQVEDSNFLGTTQLNEANTPQILPEAQSIEIETSQPEPDKSNAATPGRRKRGKGKRSKSQNKEELPVPESESNLAETPSLIVQSQHETNQSINQGVKSPQQAGEVSQADTFGIGFLSNLGQSDKIDDDDDAGMGRLQIDLEPPKQERNAKRRRGSKQARNNKTSENSYMIIPSPGQDEFDPLEPNLTASLVEESDDNKDSINTDVETDSQFDASKGENFDFPSPNQDDSLTDKRSRKGKRPKNYKEMNSGILPRTNSPRSKTSSPRSPRSAMSPKQSHKSQNSPKSEVTKAALKRIPFGGQRGTKFEDPFDIFAGKEDMRHGKVQATAQEFSMLENEAAPDITGDKPVENDKGHKTGTNVFDFNDDAELPLEPVTLQRNRGSRRKKGSEVLSPEPKAEQGSLMLSPEHNSSGSADDTKAGLINPELKFVIGSPRHKTDIFGNPRHKIDSNHPPRKIDLGNLDLKMGMFSPQPIIEAHKVDAQSEKKVVEEEKKPEPLFKAYFDNLKVPKLCIKQEADKVSAVFEKRSAEEKHEEAEGKKPNIGGESAKVIPASYSLDALKIVSPRTPATPMSNIDRIIDNVSKGIFDDIDAERDVPVSSTASLMPAAVGPVTITGVIKATNNNLTEIQAYDLSVAAIDGTNVAPAITASKRRQTRNRKSNDDQAKAGRGPPMSPPLSVSTSPTVYTLGVRTAESSQEPTVISSPAISKLGHPEPTVVASTAISKLGYPEPKKSQQAEEKQTVPSLPPVTTDAESSPVTFMTTHQSIANSTIGSTVTTSVSIGNSLTAISSATTVVMTTGFPHQAQDELTKDGALAVMREIPQTLPGPSEMVPVSVPRLPNTPPQSQPLQSQAPIGQQTQVVTSLAEMHRRQEEEKKKRMQQQQQMFQQHQQQQQQQIQQQQQQLQMQLKQEQQQLQQKQQQQQQNPSKPSEKSAVQSGPSLQQIQQDQLTKAGLASICMPHNLPLFGIPPGAARNLPPHILLANHAAQMVELVATQAAHSQSQQDKRGLMAGAGVLEPGQIHSQQHQMQQKQGLPPSHAIEKMQQQALEQQKLQLEQKLQMEQKLQQQQLEQRLKEQQHQQMEQRIQEIHRHQQALAHQQQQQQQQQQSKKLESQRGQGKKDNARARASATSASPQDPLPNHPSSHESMTQLPTGVHQQLKSPLPTHPGQPFKPGQGLPHPLHPWPQQFQPQVRSEGHREDPSGDLARSNTGSTVGTGGMPIATTGQRVSPHPPTKSPTVAQMAPNMGIMYSQHQAGTQRAPSPQVAKTAERQTPGKWPSNSPGVVRPSLQLTDGRPRIPSSEASPTTPRDLWANMQNSGAPPRTPRPAHQQPPEGAPRPAHQKLPEHSLHAEIAKDPKFLQHREQIQQEMHRQELLNLQRQEMQRQEMRQREQAAAVQAAQAQERDREREREREHARPDSRQSPSGVTMRDRLGYAFVEPRPPSQSDAKVPQSPSLIDSRFPQQYPNLPAGYHATDLRLNSTQAPSAFSPAAPGAEVAAHMYTPAELQRLQQAGLGGYPIRVFEPHVQHPSYMIPAGVHPHLAYMAQHVEHQQLIEGRPSISTSGALTPAHSVSPTQSVPQEGRVPQGRQAHMGPARPLPETPPHPGDGSLLSLLQRYPVMWQGVLALKNDQCVVQMHFIAGWQPLVKMSLPQQEPDGSIQPLRIAQRMRLEPAQLEGVAKRMQMEKDFCMLLALPCGHDHTDIYQQTRAMSGGFIQYLQSKQAAGIVNVADRNMQPAYVVHIFPPCDFSHNTLSRLGFDLHYQVKDLAHLIIIIATVG